jgi:AcrR family transcriptional regulator
MPSKATFRLDALLEALRLEVDKTSIRAVAAELGMSPSGLHILLGGSKPHPRTREKLVEWFVQRRSPTRNGREEPDVSDADADAAMRLLRRYIQANGRTALSAKRRRIVAERLLGDD